MPVGRATWSLKSQSVVGGTFFHSKRELGVTHMFLFRVVREPVVPFYNYESLVNRKNFCWSWNHLPVICQLMRLSSCQWIQLTVARWLEWKDIHPWAHIPLSRCGRYLTTNYYVSIAFYQLIWQNILDLHQVSSRSTTISSTVSRVSFSSGRISVEKHGISTAMDWSRSLKPGKLYTLCN
jgi:hypothetical protein